MTSLGEKRRRAAGRARTYRLEQLYQDQDRDWVFDSVPALVGLLSSSSTKRRQPCSFDVDHMPTTGGATTRLALSLDWDMAALELQDPAVRERARRYASGRTPHREHLPEMAGYGLALVAVSVLLPGQRVVDMEQWRSPDLLLDNTPGARRGVEVACRTSGGWAAVRSVRLDKLPALAREKTLAEVHLSLWSGWPRVSEFCKVKP